MRHIFCSAVAIAIALGGLLNCYARDFIHTGGNSSDMYSSESDPELFAAIQSSIFRKPNKLITLIREPTSLAAICTPRPHSSYELFQATLEDRLDRLWRIKLNSQNYDVNGSDEANIDRCISVVEVYVHNYDLWKNAVNRSSSN